MPVQNFESTFFFESAYVLCLLLHTKITINQKSNKLDYTYKQKIVYEWQ